MNNIQPLPCILIGHISFGKTGEYPRIFLNSQNCARCEKDLQDNKHNSLHLGRKYAQIFVLGHYLSLDIICPSYLTVFLQLHSQKTVCFLEQIMSVDKYPSIFSCQMKLLFTYPVDNVKHPLNNQGLINCYPMDNLMKETALSTG